MERKLKYMAPAILEELKIEMEGEILAQSVVGVNTEVESVGQEIEYHEDPNGGDQWVQEWK